METTYSRQQYHCAMVHTLDGRDSKLQPLWYVIHPVDLNRTTNTIFVSNLIP